MIVTQINRQYKLVEKEIPFVKPNITADDYQAVLAALESGAIGGNGKTTAEAQAWLAQYLGVKHAFITTSGSHALEMALMALDIGPGDEVILPSFAFVTAATAILRERAKPVFAEIDEATFNLDPVDVARRVTPNTKAIIPVHYAGQSCNMLELVRLAAEHDLMLIEDAAQAIGAMYRERSAGTWGDIGCFSFHSTKNIVAGEGGAFVTNNDMIGRRAEFIREKGTNRSQFLRGEVDKYTWVDIGSSYVASDLLVALLLVQLQRLDEITQARREIWWRYYRQMAPLEAQGLLRRPGLQPDATHNGHIYAFRVDPTHRDNLLTYLKQSGIQATFHFVPLHSSPYAKKHLGYKVGDFPITEQVSNSLIRLPLYPELTLAQVDYIISVVEDGLKHAV